ncbi:MAG: PulJ/GspJ family protein, partial [Thermoanaerobaculia bacterium]
MSWNPNRSRASRGFTLIELMVAVALAAMIAISVGMISGTAQQVYRTTTRKVEVYNKFRVALFTLEKDFQRWIPTGNLEFFIDGRGGGGGAGGGRRNENWEEGEELPDIEDKEHGPGVLDGGTFGEYDEFAYVVEYHYQGQEADGVWKQHDAYQAYFRTMTFVDGRVREANVEYKLLDANDVDAHRKPQPPKRVPRERMRDLTLYKIVRYHDIHPSEIKKSTANFPIVRRYVEVCSNITDFRVEYTTDNRFDNRVNPAFRTPAEDYERPAEVATRPARLPNGSLRKLFGYGSSKLQVQFDKATAYRGIFGDRGGARGDHRPVRFGFQQNPQIKFAELTPGDRIFVFTESNRGGGGNLAGQPSVGNLVQFPPGHYTVKTNLAGQLEFIQDIDSSGWPRDPTGVSYKAPFLP